MAVSAVFDGVTWKEIQGYRIRAKFVPELGFADQFYVYIVTQLSSELKLTPIAFKPDTGLRTGTLQIKGDDPKFQYEFSGTRLTAAQTLTTRRQRMQIVEFQVKFQTGSADNLQPELSFSHAGKHAVSPDDRLKGDYQVNVGGGGAEELLGFESVISESRKNLFTFTLRRNSKNSWLEAAYDLHKHVAGGDNDWKLDVTGFQALSKGLTVNSQTLSAMLVDESWGVASAWPTQPNTEMLGSSGLIPRLHPSSLTNMQFNLHEKEPDHEQLAAGRALDRGILMMQSTTDGPNYDDIEVS